jgi:hypothetical protein
MWTLYFSDLFDNRSRRQRQYTTAEIYKKNKYIYATNNNGYYNDNK